MNNKKILITFGIIVLLIILFFGYRHFSRPEIKNVPSNGAKIVAFGDSLVQGVGASTPEKNFVSRVAAHIGRPIINLGVAGDTTRSALTRLDDVLTLEPDTVIVLLGGNDYLQRIPKEETFQNLDMIVSRIQETGAAVLVIGIRGGAIRDTYESDFADFARTHKTAYVPNALDGLLGDRSLMFDQIHPNNAGYEILASRVAPILQDMFMW